MNRKPLIGISMRLELASNRFYLGRHYSEAIQGCGGVPVHIALIPDADYIRCIVAKLDGVLLPGSDSDCDPFIYGEEPLPRLGRVVPEKDRTDSLILKEVEDRKIPLFGICYGMQALNVSRGGTLFQDIQSQVVDCLRHEQGQPAAPASHGITIAPESRLSELAGAGSARVNTSHHQAVKGLGRNLKVTATAPDGIVECIEDVREDRFVIGVQWHPELSWDTDGLSRKLFESFISNCSSNS